MFNSDGHLQDETRADGYGMAAVAATTGGTAAVSCHHGLPDPVAESSAEGGREISHSEQQLMLMLQQATRHNSTRQNSTSLDHDATPNATALSSIGTGIVAEQFAAQLLHQSPVEAGLGVNRMSKRQEGMKEPAKRKLRATATPAVAATGSGSGRRTRGPENDAGTTDTGSANPTGVGYFESTMFQAVRADELDRSYTAQAMSTLWSAARLEGKRPGVTGSDVAGGKGRKKKDELASIADASERQRAKMMAWLSDMAAFNALDGTSTSTVGSELALTESIIQIVSAPASSAASGFSSLSPPCAPPRHLPFSKEAINSMGAAVRPLAMREVKAVTLALAQAIIQGSTEATHALLSDLAAASCPVGPAPQRTAHYFTSALASRVRGDGLQCYLAEVPSDLQAYEYAYMLYNVRTPLLHFLSQSCLTSVLRALNLEYEAALDNCQQRQKPLERIHIIDTNIEFAVLWLQFIRQLADRAHPPPHCVRITLLDVLPPIMEKVSEGRRVRAMQLKEQLSVQAVVAGIEEFECDVILCSSSRIAEGLAQVNVNAADRAMRWRRTASSRMYRTCESHTGSHGGEFLSKRMKRTRGDSVKRQHLSAGGQEGWSRAHSVEASGDGRRPVADFLAVVSLMKLFELHNEPREVLVKWVRSLHPDIFVVHEALCDSSGPFTVPCMGRVFDYFSHHIFGHDLFCTPQDPSRLNPHNSSFTCDADATNFTVEAETEPCALVGFRFGLPQSHMRSPEMAGKAMLFSKPLDPSHMLGFERFVFFRAMFTIIAMEGAQRCVHQMSHEQWASFLRDHGFVVSPVVPSVVQHMFKLSEGYHRHSRVSPAIGGVTLDMCNLSVMSTSLWTV